MNVVVDDREPGVVADALRGIEGVCVDVGRLGVGDYLVDGRVVFERKTVRDFKISLIDGRLFGQACRMVDAEGRAAMIVENDSGDISAPRVSRESVQGAMIMLSVVLGIPILRSRDPDETAWLIHQTAIQMHRSTDDSIKRPGYRPIGKRKRQLYVLQGLPEVGPKRAKALLEHFGTVEAVMSADEESLAHVPGIGKPIIDKILHVVKESRSHYGTPQDHDLFDL